MFIQLICLLLAMTAFGTVIAFIIIAFALRRTAYHLTETHNTQSGESKPMG